MTQQILVVEDDESLREILQFNLEIFGYQVTACANVPDAQAAISERCFDLMIFDVMLPGGCGLQLCRFARKRCEDANIIMLTSLGEEQDKIQGLEMGADDYLTKPFSLRELQARIKARLRRHVPSQQTTNALNLAQTSSLNIGELEIDAQRHQVRICGEQVELTAKEFELLAHLAKHQGQVFNREQLLKDIWGYQFDGYEHTVNTHINRLRKKLAPLDYVHTVWGVGYKLDHSNAAHCT